MIGTTHQHTLFIKIMQNGNAVLCSNKSNDILITPCPLKHLKKYVKREYESPTTKLTNSMTPVTNARPEYVKREYKSLTTKLTNSATPVVRMQEWNQCNPRKNCISKLT